MMRFYRVSDGDHNYDMFLIVYQSKGDKRSFPAAYRDAVAWARRNRREEWNRDDVLSYLRQNGWDVISPDYDTIQESLS